MLRQLSLAALLAFAAAPAAANCQQPDEPISGRLALLETRHASGAPIKGWVVLTADTCITMELADGETGDVTVGVAHLVFGDKGEPADLMSLASDEVTVAGEPMEPHTAWHLGDVVLMNARIVEDGGQN